MKKCMNEREQFVDDSLSGILAAYPEFYETANDDLRAIVHSTKDKNKVHIITGGGYGHLPVFLGYVGDGLCDGAAVGNVFTSPSCETIMNVTHAMNNEKGVLYLFGNYFGDSMNFDMASEFMEMEGIHTAIVKSSDDMASAPREQYTERRGIAGIFFCYKIAGACADTGASLEEVRMAAEKAAANTASFGVAFSSCTLPEMDAPIFELAEDEIEIGMGIHGEPGIHRGKMITSRELAQTLCQPILKDLSLAGGDRIAVLVNGLGSTSREELYILYNDIHKIMAEQEIIIVKPFIGEYVTSLEMAGLSVSILKLDSSLEELLQKPAYTPFAQI